MIATTSISAHKLGEPGTYFDMVIMDEASQGNIAVSLVPIIRGRNLMLVGDPQQLSPVIVLDPVDNAKLKKIYGVTHEYDYIQNSIYKAYLACDSVSGRSCSVTIIAAMRRLSALIIKSIITINWLSTAAVRKTDLLFSWILRRILLITRIRRQGKRKRSYGTLL